MKFQDFNLTINDEFVTIDTFKVPFTVLKYLNIEDKNALIQLAVQNSEENGVINPLKLDMYFGLYLVYMYTDIEFTDEDKANELALYNILYSNGIINAVITALEQMENGEYSYLESKLYEFAGRKMKYHNTIASVINGFIERMPINAEKAMEIINKFNPEDFQQVLQFARAANGDRPIN